MGTLNTVYRAGSLSEIAEGLRAIGNNKDREAEGQPKRRKYYDLKAEARGLYEAADIVENTTLVGKWEPAFK